MYSNPDLAQKRRYMKNVFSFLDHPLSFIHWKLRPYYKSGRIRGLIAYWLFLYLGSWWIAGHALAVEAKYKAVYKVREGHELVESPVEVFSDTKLHGQRFTHSEGNAERGMISDKNLPPLHSLCRLNFHIRDQNIRKYIAHRERRGADVFTGKPK